MKSAYWKEWCRYSPIISIIDDKAKLECGDIVSIEGFDVSTYSSIRRKPRVGDIYRTHYKVSTDETIPVILNPKAFAYFHTDEEWKQTDSFKVSDP